MKLQQRLLKCNHFNKRIPIIVYWTITKGMTLWFDVSCNGRHLWCQTMCVPAAHDSSVSGSSSLTSFRGLIRNESVLCPKACHLGWQQECIVKIWRASKCWMRVAENVHCAFTRGIRLTRWRQTDLSWDDNIKLREDVNKFGWLTI